MQVVSKVIRLDLNYASEVSHLYQKRTCYIAPYKTELAEHFARRLLAYLSFFEFSPQLSKTEGAGKTPDLYVSDATDHIKLWCNVDLLSEKHMQRASHQADQVVWGQVSSPDGFHVMAYDVQHDLERDAGRNAFYFSLRSTDADTITGYWTALAAGSTVEVELGPSVFSPLYGKLTDRFGVVWIIDVMVPYGG